MIALILPAALMLSPAASHASAVPSALFAAQARAAHLSATQQAALRREVNKIIARYGGHQIALNEIALAHDSSVLFPLPGQRVARVLPGTPPLPVDKAKIAHATKAAVSPAWSTGQTWYAPNGASCQFYFLCTWQGQNFTGANFNVSDCNTWQELPGSGWDSYGSWVNNQRFGTRAYLGDSDEQLLATIPADGSENPEPVNSNSMSWAPVWYLMACQD